MISSVAVATVNNKKETGVTSTNLCEYISSIGPPLSEVQSQCGRLTNHDRANHASLCWKALWGCWFHFLAGLGPSPHHKKHQKLVKWIWFYCAWLARKLGTGSLGSCQEENDRHLIRYCSQAERCYQSNFSFHNTKAEAVANHLQDTAVMQ